MSHQALASSQTSTYIPIDVGGGSVKNSTKHCLANASLVWMVNHVISADVGVIFKRRAFEGLEHKGLRPIFQSGTPLLATLGPPSPDGTASQASCGELSIVLENAEGSTSEIDVPDGEPGSSGRVPPARKPTIMPGNFNQGASKEETPPSATSRTKKFSTLLKVFDRQSSTTSPPRPPSPSSPMGSFSPISPIIASMRNGVISAADANAVPILLAPRDPKSGRALNDNDPRALVRLTQADEVADANSHMVDQLDKRKFWWLLEVIPLWQHYQDQDAYWHKGFHLNR
ncbi:hypothetical protein FRC00_013846, partial [Tulasnella sp. 408]